MRGFFYLMTTLGIDIETYSSESLKTAGVYRYSEADDFEILMVGYAIDNQEVQILDGWSQWFLDALVDPTITKTAWNAQFEMVCLGKFLKYKPDPAQWECTMIRSAMLGSIGSRTHNGLNKVICLD